MTFNLGIYKKGNTAMSKNRKNEITSSKELLQQQGLLPAVVFSNNAMRSIEELRNEIYDDNHRVCFSYAYNSKENNEITSGMTNPIPTSSDYALWDIASMSALPNVESILKNNPEYTSAFFISNMQNYSIAVIVNKINVAYQQMISYISGQTIDYVERMDKIGPDIKKKLHEILDTNYSCVFPRYGHHIISEYLKMFGDVYAGSSNYDAKSLLEIATIDLRAYIITNFDCDNSMIIGNIISAISNPEMMRDGCHSNYITELAANITDWNAEVAGSIMDNAAYLAHAIARDIEVAAEATYAGATIDGYINPVMI